MVSIQNGLSFLFIGKTLFGLGMGVECACALPLKEITRVNFGGDYENALNLVEKDPGQREVTPDYQMLAWLAALRAKMINGFMVQPRLGLLGIRPSLGCMTESRWDSEKS